MKTLKILTCAVTMAVALILCSTSAKANETKNLSNNYSSLSVSLTLESTTATSGHTKGQITDTIQSQKIDNKTLLNLFTNADFAGIPFPESAQLVVSWELLRYGHILVMDTNGEVFYDATKGTTNKLYSFFDPFTGTTYTNVPYTNYFSIDFWAARGAQKGTEEISVKDAYNLTEYNFASLNLVDNGTNLINIIGLGPCIEKTSSSTNSSSQIAKVIDSENFTVSGAGGSIAGLNNVTITGTVQAGVTSTNLSTIGENP